MSSLRLAGLTKTFVRGERGAVDGIDLEVRDGEILALLGPSGCGKTTTLSLIAGFLRPDAGEIWAGERLLSDARKVVPPEKRRMSIVFQSYAVWPHKTVRENVSYGLKLQGVKGAALRERVDALLEIVRLRAKSESYPAELSGGQQQRVALARAIVVRPSVLLLDEPLSNLDPALREEMRVEIRRLHDATGVTMVYVTHDRTEAMVTADRIAVLNHGRLVQLGTPTELFERPATPFVAEFIGRANVVPGIVRQSGSVDCGAFTFESSEAVSLSPGSAVSVCVQPHRIALTVPETGGVTGRVVFASFLGETREYLVELGGGLRLRVVAPSSQPYAVDSTVGLRVPPEACRVFASGVDQNARPVFDAADFGAQHAVS